jgi:hypothetical protein
MVKYSAMKTLTIKKSSPARSQPASQFFKRSNPTGFFSPTNDARSPFFGGFGIQPKLTIGQPEDKYEKEADAVADNIVQNQPSVLASGTIMKKCEECVQEETVSTKEEDQQPELMKKPLFESSHEMGHGDVQAKAMPANSSDFNTRLQNSRGSGIAISPDIRTSMESGFGADFKKVRLHTDDRAIQMNRELNAQAFTSGKDIYFNEGKYKPENTEGKKLLAHELTHVVQQNGDVRKKPEEANNSKKSVNQNSTKSFPLKIGSPSLSIKCSPDGQHQLIQRFSFSQIVPKARSQETQNGEGSAQKEESIFIDKILPSEQILSTSHDNAIISALSHVPTVTSGGPVGAGNFGTTGASLSFSNVNIDASFGTLIGEGIYTVTGDVEHEIHWGVLSGTGPGSQVDIQNDSDPDISACNYQLVSKDLTPNMSSDNGRPPRSKYWAEDLTIRHEKFHAINQRKLSWGPIITSYMQMWLSGRTANSASHIQNTLMPQAISEGIRLYNIFVGLPSTEGDTYGDGAPSYRARANAIKTKGDIGGYGQISALVTVHPKGGGTHEVVSGDTLWGISEQIYGHGRYWRKIYRANPGKTKQGGNLIFPGTILDIPAVNFDQELSVLLGHGTNLSLTSNVLIAGGSSHEFKVLPSDLFDDSANCTGDVNVEIFDPMGISLLSSIWPLPAATNSRNGNITLSIEIK